MSQRVKVQEMAMQMHETNLVLINIIRDIAENETLNHLAADATDEERVRAMNDGAVRRKQIVGEIFNFLCREELAGQVHA